MAEIRVLDKHTAELIAAGEVVERSRFVVFRFSGLMFSTCGSGVYWLMRLSQTVSPYVS